MKYCKVLLLIILVSGCAGPFSNFYQDNTGGMDITKSTRFIVSTDKPKLFRGDIPEKDGQRMIEEGFALIGYSAFYAGNVNMNQASIQAKKVHASVVLVYSEYKDTLSGVAPKSVPDRKTSSTSYYGNASGSGNVYGCGNVLGCISASETANANIYGSSTTTTNGTKTVYVPYSIDRFNYMATYWIKLKPPVLGVFPHDLTPEIRKKMGSNKGIIVYAVVKDSPAFRADILKDDILKKMENEEIMDTKSFQDLLEKYSGKTVEVFISREGKEIRKKIQFNQRPE